MLALYTALSARLQRDEEGATAVEYGLLVGLIAVVIIGVVVTLGGNLSDMFGGVGEKIGSVNNEAGFGGGEG